MANYDTIAEAINADTSNMTVLRDHVKNDDSTSEYTTGIDWFKFNNVVVGKIYSSGNSWLGFGANSEQLLVNRRDCAVWDEYSESGMVGGNRFFKFKWCGVSAYNADPTTEATKQWYDVFLLDNGQIYLYFYVVPTSSCTGDNVLVCGNSTVRFTVNEGTSCEYTFKAADATAGTGWLVVSGKPTIDPAPEPKPTPTVVYNFLPGRYRAFVRTTYINGLNETKTCTSNAYEFSNNTPVITDAFMGTGATWGGSEVEIAWSGDYNSLTVQISNAHIVFKMYMGSTLIYTFTSPVGTSTTDIDKIHVGFLIDDENEVAKPSFIYDNGNDTYQYNQEAPTDAEMGLIYEWLGGEGGSGVYDFDYTGSIQTFTAPKTGIYQLETWGAQGGDATDGEIVARGGYGAYAYGEVLLTQGETLYINVGGQNGYGGGGNFIPPELEYIKNVNNLKLYRSNTFFEVKEQTECWGDNSTHTTAFDASNKTSVAINNADYTLFHTEAGVVQASDPTETYCFALASILNINLVKGSGTSYTAEYSTVEDGNFFTDSSFYNKSSLRFVIDKYTRFNYRPYTASRPTFRTSFTDLTDAIEYIYSNFAYINLYVDGALWVEA